jgi:hypothetical protein
VIILLSFLLAFPAFADSIVNQFIDAEGRVQPCWKSLLVLDELYEENDSLKEIVAKTQKNWIASLGSVNGVERRDIKDSDAQLAQKDLILQIIINNKWDQGQEIQKEHYSYGLCLGAFAGEFVHRLVYLLEEAEKCHATFDEPFFLQEKGI